MSRLNRLASLARVALFAARGSKEVSTIFPSAGAAAGAQKNLIGAAGLPALKQSAFPNRTFASDAAVPVDIEHATGLERQELEMTLKGIDPWREEWLDAPWGTVENPVVVTSEFSERIVGVPDGYDDSIVWWGVIHEGDPPKQITEGGEYFVLKRVPSDDPHHH